MATSFVEARDQKTPNVSKTRFGISTLIGVSVNKLYIINNKGKKTSQNHICYYFHLANSRPIKSAYFEMKVLHA